MTATKKPKKSGDASVSVAAKDCGGSPSKKETQSSDSLGNGAASEHPNSPSGQDAIVQPRMIQIVYVSPTDLTDHVEAHRIPPMRDDQFKVLLDDMGRWGFRPEFALHITGKHVILDGRYRRNAAIQSKITLVPCAVVDVEDEIDYLYTCALRRDLNDDQRGVLLLQRFEHLTEKFKAERARKAAAARHRSGSLSEDVADKQAKPAKRDARKQIAEEHNYPEHKLRRITEVKRTCPEALPLILAGTKSIAGVLRAKNEEDRQSDHARRLEDAKKLPDLADWRHGDGTKLVRSLDAGIVRLLLIDHEDESNILAMLKAIDVAMSDECNVFAFCDWREEGRIAKLLQGQSFEVAGRLIWYHDEAACPGESGGPLGATQTILWARRGKAQLDGDEHYRLPAVLTIPSVGGREHPQQKPELLLSALIEAGAQQSQLVVDPFGGVATTVLAARRKGRRVVSFEIDDTYYALGRDRIERELHSMNRLEVASAKNALSIPGNSQSLNLIQQDTPPPEGADGQVDQV